MFNSAVYLCTYIWTTKQIILNKEFCNFSAPIWPNKDKNWKRFLFYSIVFFKLF